MTSMRISYWRSQLDLPSVLFMRFLTFLTRYLIALLKLPGQRPLLYGRLEEEHTNLLASNAFPCCGRTRHPIEAC